MTVVRPAARRAAPAVLAAALAVASPSAVLARQEAATPSAREKRTSAPTADIDRLPISLSRIRRELAEAASYRERFEDFRLITILNVYGQAPRFELFTPEEEASLQGGGGVRYGSPTHSEFLAQVAPRNFRAPVMNLSGNLFSLTSAVAERRREAQRRREDEERRRRQQVP